MAALAQDDRERTRQHEAGPDPRRWLILVIVATAQLMVVLDTTVMNIALPSAQSALHFTIVDRQWVVTAYALAFGSLLLLGGKLADLLGRRATFMAGVIGFAAASAVGGASTTFGMLVTARACQGVFGALLAPSVLSLLSTTFTDSKERGRAFGIFSAIAGAGGAVGLLLGGVLTEYLSWRWSMYVNLVFAGIAGLGAVILLRRQPPRQGPRPRVDVLGAALVSGGMFCIVYGFSNAGMHNWHTPSTWGFLAAGGAGLVLFGAWQARARQPLLPPRVVIDRTRAGAYLSVLIASIGMFSLFLFLTYYMQQTLGFSPVIAGTGFLPMIGVLVVTAQVVNIVLMPRTGPRPLIPLGMLVCAGALALLTRLGTHSGYAPDVLPSLLLMGLGLGLAVAPVFNSGTAGVAPSDSGVASATINTGQQIGGSIGTSLLNTIAAGAAASYVTSHLVPGVRPGPALLGAAQVNGSTHAFWVSAAIFLGGLVVSAVVLRSGPLPRTSRATAGTDQADAAAQDTGAQDTAYQDTAATAATAPADASAAPTGTGTWESPVSAGTAQSGTAQSGTARAGIPALAAQQPPGPRWDTGDELLEPVPVPAPVREEPPAYAGAGAAWGGGGPGVRGHVRRADGTPVSGAILTLISLDGRQAGRALSGPDGAYRVPAPSPGSYTMIAVCGGLRPQADTVVAGDRPADHDMVMLGASSLAGTVRRAGTGEPLADAALSLADTRGEIVAGRITDEAGAYLFEDLVPGGYTLAVTAMRHQPVALPVTIVDGQRATRDVELDGGTTVRGNARTAEGTAVPGAQITLIDQAGSVLAITITGSDGTYALENVPTGDYTVIASGYPPVASAVTVTAGPANIHDIQLGYPEA